MFDGSDVAQRWSKWRKSFETYHIAAELSKKSPEVQVAILLHSAGSEAQEIFGQFVFTNEDDSKDIKKVLDHFSTYCNPRKNTVYERYRFWSRNQTEGEAVDKWVKDLKTIASNCEFKDEDNMIRDKIVFGYRELKVKERMLRESTLTLTKALEICRAAESTKTQMQTMNSEGQPRDVNTLNEESVNELICYNCNRPGHYSRDCEEGDNFPRGRRRGRGRGHRGDNHGSQRGGSNSRGNSRGGARGSTRGGRGGSRGGGSQRGSRGGSRGSSRGGSNNRNVNWRDQQINDVEEEGLCDYADLSTLSLHSLSIYQWRNTNHLSHLTTVHPNRHLLPTA